jgi:hypothetical protein
MVGNGNRFHTKRLGLIEKRINADGTVEQTVLRVNVQMDKGVVWRIRHS